MRSNLGKHVAGSGKRNVLLAVSEYGEFFHLLGLASTMVAELGIHPVFLFKLDYGALKLHSQIVEARGFSWVAEKSSREVFDLSEVELAHDDYVPHSLATSDERSQPATKTTYRGPVRNAHAILLTLLKLGRPLWLLTLPVLLPVAVLLYVFKRLVDFLLRFVRAEHRKHPMMIPGDFRYSIKSRLQRMENIFEHFDPVLVISGQDYPLSVTTLAAKIAELRDVQTVILPFSMTPTTKEVAESFAGLGINRVHGGITGYLLRRAAPQWLHRYRGRTYKRLPLPDILASEIYRLSPPQPWTPNSGRGVILASSRQSVDYCRSAGIPADKLHLTGALWDDELADRERSREPRRAALIRDMQLSYLSWQSMQRRSAYGGTGIDQDTAIMDDRKLVILSWPPNQFPRTATGFSSYKSFNHALVDMLASLRRGSYANIVISLHPTLVGTEYADYIREAGLIVMDGELIDVIDCADIFVATVSSTLMWGLQRGVPSINFDPYRYQYREFHQAGMLECASIRQLRHNLLSLVTEQEALRRVTENMAASRDYWTTRDGRSRERILSVIRTLMRDRPSQQQTADDLPRTGAGIHAAGSEELESRPLSNITKEV